jgi:hypothetical protein
MRKFLLFLAIICFQCLMAENSFATSTPTTGALTIPPSGLYMKISSMKLKDLKKSLGRKLTLKEKVAFLVLKHKARKAEEKNDGQSALTVGFISVGLLILGLFVPYVLIGAFVAGILALVMGGMAKKSGGDNRKAKMAQLLGIITLVSIAFLFILAALLITSIF